MTSNEEVEVKKKAKSPQEVEKAYLDNCKIAVDNTILRVVSGSRAYGTQLPTSDYDERGIFIDIPERVWLPFAKLEQIQLPEDDIVLYELSKYVTLLSEQNPNIMEIIWTEPEDVLYANNAGKFLIENREKFLSKEVASSYSGYAMSQLRRIKGHNGWMNNPQPEELPRQDKFISVSFNLSDNPAWLNFKSVDSNEFKAVKVKDGNVALYHKSRLPNLPVNAKGWIDRLGNPAYSTIKDIQVWAGGESGVNKPDLIVKVSKEEFELAKQKHKDYWSWVKGRNEKRSALEQAHGYDTKHAMHLIRLLRSGVEILETGNVPVRRKDAQELLDIRNGKYTYEELLYNAQILDEKVKGAYKKSDLPDKVDKDLVKEVTFEMYRKHWEENGYLKQKKTKLNMK